ncbi:MAG: efflux RND transporter periplasmic adaptor subunit [Chloracidobacterium sp.]|uniref:Efflux RND transporter periplasmic adaptor subunit n=1 Tax=Chloracidobacterium validum TaxID=2821543 RepID=A0ABX8BB51_9BACT|nr:efflux RND transporter periplasmic adaptor subunit [Chloracidobacterium validum]QUW04164.1 efflux RND transporter periplasmic adaptor subunit [Chloracidobacterium validum]
MTTHRLAGCLTVGCLAAALSLGCQNKTETAAPPAPLDWTREVRVEPVAVERAPRDEVIAPGKVELDPNRIARVMLPLPGRITDVRVRVGDAVRAGQPLVTLESPDVAEAVGALRQAEAALVQARAGLAQAEAALAKAEQDAERAKDLYEHRAIAQKEVLAADNVVAQSQAAVEQARAVVSQAEAGREQVRRRLETLGLDDSGREQRMTVRAPLNGKVLELAVVPGEYRTDTSVSLMTVADLSRLIITANVPEASLYLVQVGENVEVELTAFPDQRFTGRVARIGDTIDPQTRAARVIVELTGGAQRLRPDMFARLRLSDEPTLLPVVPKAAVVEREGVTGVFIEREPGKFDWRPIRVGVSLGERVAVLEGLQSGERVVVGGTMLLYRN